MKTLREKTLNQKLSASRADRITIDMREIVPHQELSEEIHSCGRTGSREF
jgi:hypothetical protein